MITFRLTRDQARMVEQNWITYMVLNAQAELNSNAGDDVKYLNCLSVLSLLKDVELMFKKKLINTLSNKLKFDLTVAHGCAFYVYLMKRPIDPLNVYACAFRQQLCDSMHRQLFASRPPAHEGVKVTMVDYEL